MTAPGQKLLVVGREIEQDILQVPRCEELNKCWLARLKDDFIKVRRNEIEHARGRSRSGEEEGQ